MFAGLSGRSQFVARGLAAIRPGILVEGSLWSQHVIPTPRRDTQAHSLTQKEIGSGRGRRRSVRAARPGPCRWVGGDVTEAAPATPCGKDESFGRLASTRVASDPGRQGLKLDVWVGRFPG